MATGGAEGGRPLHPFTPDPSLAGFELRCAATWEQGILSLHFQLSGGLGTLVLPCGTGNAPQRRDGLWQSTCFEAFIGQPDDPSYWELNLAPGGDWNLYALTGYRSQLQPERRIERLPFSLQRQPLEPAQPSGPGTTPSTEAMERLDLQLSVDLRALIPAESPLELSATAVLESVGQGCSYWAWRHNGPEPDFHRRDSFLPL